MLLGPCIGPPIPPALIGPLLFGPPGPPLYMLLSRVLNMFGSGSSFVLIIFLGSSCTVEVEVFSAFLIFYTLSKKAFIVEIFCRTSSAHPESRKALTKTPK